jgi:Rrf2 family transcriptional regulator, nitric oxide-sensitive transcriptional repressor
MLLYLGIIEDATIAEIARDFHISRNHLVKVAHNLGKEGYIHTMRGRSGGLRLARPPAEIIVGDVVRHMESSFNLLDCFRPQHQHCAIYPACSLKDVLGQAYLAFMQVLDSYTLEDLLKDKDLMVSLLRPDPATADA